MANKNKNLNVAAKNKKDEFYTRREDIENELRHYKNHFKDKIVFCNCDDPYESEFFKFFAMRFNTLGLKKLIATNYVGSPVFQTEFSFDGTPNEIKNFDKNKQAIKIEISEVPVNPEKGFSLSDLEFLLKNTKNIRSELHGDEKYFAGDFRSQECIEILKTADIVVTNPPFSLFREYVRQLIDFDKKFLIIGNVNAITYKEIFPLIMENKIWIGASIHSGDREFMVPEYYPLTAATFRVDENGKKFIRVKGVRWYTNLDYKIRHEDLPIFKKYSHENYPKYDNYDAIEVSKTAEIPRDYFGVMGVPITFLDKYNPDQFEIIGMLADKRNENPAFLRGTPTYLDEGHKNYVGAIVNGKATYARILIRRR